MTRFSLAVGSAQFWDMARADVAAARQRLLVQAMTFEGDAAGLGVAEAIAACPAADRRVLVDDYTRHVINDTFLALTRAPHIKAEAQETWAMFDRIRASGAGLRLTNPVGRNPLAYAVRNHKKLLVMDGVAWIGGINFSDHNFAWHDMMLRIEDAAVADWLAAQFDADWAGTPQPGLAHFDDLSLASIDGTANEAALGPLLDLLSGAQRSIEVISAYPTFPFVTAMAAAAARGVPVTLYTPRANNKPIIRHYLMGVAGRSGLSIRLMEGMTHVKAALVDGEALVVGSCNFDFVGYRANAEYVATVSDANIIADFAARLFDPACTGSVPVESRDRSPLRALVARAGLGIADAAVKRLSPGPRPEHRVAGWREKISR